VYDIQDISSIKNFQVFVGVSGLVAGLLVALEVGELEFIGWFHGVGECFVFQVLSCIVGSLQNFPPEISQVIQVEGPHVPSEITEDSEIYKRKVMILAFIAFKFQIQSIVIQEIIQSSKVLF
jgi:hypothetical protein